MYYIGLDSGSTTTKGVLFHQGKIVEKALLPTAGNPKQAMEEILVLLQPKDPSAQIKTITTGYGRKLITADLVITEITCHAKGARYLDEMVTKVIDIGGQDCKTIALNESGTVSDFNMNDKCAAGTGRFVEVMMRTLGEEIEELDIFVKDAKPVAINSMCTVFAESEIISLIAKGEKRNDIALGVLHSISKRISNQYTKLQSCSDDQLLFTGGLSKSKEFTNVLSVYLKQPILTHDLSQYAGAIGAAITGSTKLK